MKMDLSSYSFAPLCTLFVSHIYKRNNNIQYTMINYSFTAGTFRLLFICSFSIKIEIISLLRECSEKVYFFVHK